MRFFIVLSAFLMFTLQLAAQETVTHAVQEGETIYSIARKYRVTPFNILKANKGLKQEDILKPNTVLIIPLDAAASDIKTSDTREEAEKEAEELVQRQPLGFKNHRVRRKETLFGIAKRYDITEEDIKRYNTDLYASPLKKGMRLKIPEFPVVEVAEDSINLEDFETYTVLPKETRWSIAHKYGITVDSLINLNPDLPRTTNHLAVGQELMLPKIAGTSVDSLTVQLYESYTVPPKKTLYSLGREYGIPSSDIVKLNPEIVEQGGLKEGMVIRLPKKTLKTEEVNTDNYIFYEVKPKQTIFSLTRDLSVRYDELLELNPDLSRGLQAGMVLKLPSERAVDLEVKNALILDKINLLDSINTDNHLKLIYLLPFRLDKVDFKDRENAKKTISGRNDIKYSLGLYTGAMIALDSIADLGISVDIKTFDTQLSLDKTREILIRENINNYNAVVGPLQPNALKEVAVQAANYDVPVIAPLAAQSEISLANVFFSIPADSLLRQKMLNYISTKVTEQNIIVIADEKRQNVAAQIKEKFPLAKLVEVKEEEENISIDLEQFQLQLSEDQENWVFVETDNFKLVSSVSSILNSTITEDISVRMFTTSKNKAFDNDVISSSHLSNLKFTYPSVYREVGSDAFVRRYRRKFGSTPDRYAVRGFDLTFDLLLKLAYRMNLFQASETIGVTEYTGNKFNYAKDLSSGYFNTASYIMMYEDMFIKEVKPQQSK
ncbi:LysM peptidoglycan-binding domain-containing protein [Poritiphilus flavus]|uniref:LysM peptidoglycan-binding domain-containing protein n=1 Tax=Poritiphilus flavus TaxID=2697053 RepID=A0A6L9EB70_9FLAO|nr:LysM peptidoglycan-binding domain-containing protein [Poritiphilus flavus]NAS12015.1 LysM peptidoglycan-binding domain-containing protein [Poritiphilus flavus]